MEFNISQVPFSRAFSYMAVSELSDNWHGYGNKAGLCLKTVSGSASNPLVAMIIPDGDVISTRLEHAALMLDTPHAKYSLAFADSETLLIKGVGPGAELTLDFMTGSGAYDYIYKINSGITPRFIANCYKNNCTYVMWAQEGGAELMQKWKEQSSQDSKLMISGENGFLFAVKEIAVEWDRQCPMYHFDECVLKNEREFLDFYGKLPEVPDEYRETAFLGAYINWSAYVGKRGFFTREAMLMSKNHMCSVWSWDHCFNALALSYHNPEAAWEQFMIMFDTQDSTGRLPDSVNDSKIIWNYCKPPIHGWALNKITANANYGAERLLEAFSKLEKYTLWWIRYRDFDGDGLYEYCHGNDSGWDNSTVFAVEPPIESPELQAFLIIQMETLCNLAEKLGMTEKSAEWSAAAQALLERFIENNFVDNMPAAFKSGTKTAVKNNSLLPYLSLILGERLPEEYRREMIKSLKEGGFLTEHGFATESPMSADYRPDGYWRGPVWAPSTVLLLDGLTACGERGLAVTAAKRFLKLAKKSGFAENYDALTGEGLRDRAYTWTVSAMFILAAEYLG